MHRSAYPWVGGLAVAAGTCAALADPFLPMKAVWLGLLVFAARRWGRLPLRVVIGVPVAVALGLALPGLRSTIPHPWREEIVVLGPLFALVAAGAGAGLARR